MAKFIVDISSPDGKFIKEEIESALNWLMNHNGIMIRGFYKVEEFHENGVIDAHEVTLEFFRKYLKMPGANLEDMCLECMKLKRLGDKNG